MSEETTPTRQETVEANIQAILDQRGQEDFKHIVSKCVQDISISLAMLVDSQSTAAGED